MAKDAETGIDPKATDGEPDGKVAELEIERRRLKKAERERAEEEATGLSDHGNGGKRGQPIDDQPEAPAAEMFPSGSIPGDHKVTMKNIVPPAKARRTEAKLGSTAIPLRDGLVRYGEHVELLVTAEAGKVEEVPELDGDDSSDRRTLMGVKDRQHFRPVHVTSAAGMFSLDQVLDVLELHFGVTRNSDKVREVFGLEGPQAAAAG